jgi:hypothetical protein
MDKTLTTLLSDIAWTYPPDIVMGALKDTWDIPLSKGGKVLALTIPETKGQNSETIERRDAINLAIKEYRRHNLYVTISSCLVSSVYPC